MAELPADSFNKHSEEPVIATKQTAQPQRPDTSPSSQGEDVVGLHGACEIEDSASVTKSEDDESPREDVLDCDDFGIDRPSTGAPQGADSQIAVKKKKKKKSKRTAKSRRNITGFEEYYADTPMTPREALEKKKLYDPLRPFPERIEECIQRFRARRRLDSQRTAMFNKYLFLGGIDSSQRQFTGMADDRDGMAEADSELIRTMTAIDFIGGHGNRFYNASTTENWEVDFEAVVKGYLSRTIIDWYMYDRAAIQIAADLIKNFLNYVLMHDVCPEYASSIIAARHICDIAPIELHYIHELTLELPGGFNRAARSLFCNEQIKDPDEGGNSEALVQFNHTTLVWSLSEKSNQIKQKILETTDLTTMKVISTMDKTYEILGIERPRHKDIKMVHEKLVEQKVSSELKPAGFIRVIPAVIAHGWGNMPRPDEVDFSSAEEEEFVLEDELLAKLEVGMKMKMTVCELNIGLRFIKEVHDLRVSFDTFLPQYLMTNWKDPVPNERPPPSVHNPDAEEKVMGSEMNADD
ncbi:Argonaute siRNA chaperone complex subunit Arb1-domain-containing protein [Xylaria sp. FL1042]|nr:Argonaute siRNA chaperone complex subunit Arb1-domain-containing protein [Xylaria sp. FL1042]